MISKNSSLFRLTLALGGVPILVQLGASFYYFKHTYKHLAPSIKLINLSYAKNLLNIGGAFFFLQIGALVLLQTDNIVITHVLGPQYVTDFNIAYKLFAVFTSVFTIIISPFWTAFTDAYAKKDFVWIQKSMRRIKEVCAVLAVIVILVLVFSKWIFAMWMGDLANIPFSLSLSLAVYVIFFMWHNAHVYLLNGIGRVKRQLIVATIMTSLNIPLAIYLGEQIGLAGIVTANTIVYAVTGFFCYRECQTIIKTSLPDTPIQGFGNVKLVEEKVEGS
jgi:O-antigen/teichoic acid export membrane protein